MIDLCTGFTLHYLGLNIHKYWTQAARHLHDGSIRGERLTTDPVLLRQLADRLAPEDVVALESTTRATAVANLLKQKARTVLISNPLRARLIAESHIKTDKVDAGVLAQPARSGFPPTAWQPPQHVEFLRRRSAHHAALGRQITRVKTASAPSCSGTCRKPNWPRRIPRCSPSSASPASTTLLRRASWPPSAISTDSPVPESR